MGMTMTQKILAQAAGLAQVQAGQLIEAQLDLVLGNDITSPVAIKEMDKMKVQGGGDHDTTHALCHMSACKYLRCGAQIVNTSVRTGSDHYLINDDGLHLVDLIDGMCILRQMRECHGRP